jgi:hypothetical protein
MDNPYDLHGWNRYIYAGDDPVNMTDPSGNLPVISQRQVRMICRRHPSECRGHKINWRSVGDFAKDLGKHILLGAAGGAVVGCGIGAGSMAELGPPGWIGGCIVVAPPGAVLGARYGVGEFLYPYVGPLGEALLVGG